MVYEFVERILRQRYLEMESRLKCQLPGGEFTDVSEVRSRTMAAIRGKGNKTTERRLRFTMVRAGLCGWTLQDSSLPGKPDFLFPRLKVAIFVDGCFWHACEKCSHLPQTRSSFWAVKLDRNRERDHKVNRTLRALGFHVLRIWEHELADTQRCIAKVQKMLQKSRICPRDARQHCSARLG